MQPPSTNAHDPFLVSSSVILEITKTHATPFTVNFFISIIYSCFLPCRPRWRDCIVRFSFGLSFPSHTLSGLFILQFSLSRSCFFSFKFWLTFKFFLFCFFFTSLSSFYLCFSSSTKRFFFSLSFNAFKHSLLVNNRANPVFFGWMVGILTKSERGEHIRLILIVIYNATWIWSGRCWFLTDHLFGLEWQPY